MALKGSEQGPGAAAMVLAIAIAGGALARLFAVRRASRASERRYQQLLESVPEQAERGRQLVIDVMNEAYMAFDAEGRITDWNRQASRILGFERDEVLGRPATETVVAADDRAEFEALIGRWLVAGRGGPQREVRIERAARHRDGHALPVELAAATMETDGERSLHVFMHDITERKRSASEAEAHARDVEALAEASAALARSTELEDAREAICRAAERVAAADVAILFEPEKDQYALAVSAAAGVDPGLVSLPLEGNRSGAARAFSSGEVLFVDDLASEPDVHRSMVAQLGVASALWLPVERDRTAIGVIAVGWQQHHGELSARVLRMLTVLAAEAAVAIERGELLDRLGRMARTDDLTGLPNRRAWNAELKHELARAQRHSTGLTVAMVDLDHFKAYNDDHGHQAGDRLLKEAAGAWRDALRETDLLARYGGEEFAIALPNCDGRAAVALIDRLREVTPMDQSCSAGVATWDRSESPHELIARVDRALYAAKQGGRDRTVIG